MSFFDSIGKTFGQGVDRVKFEAEKFQKINRLQGDINELRKQVDQRRVELGDLAYNMYKSGKFDASLLTPAVQVLDSLRASLALKESELQTAQKEEVPASPPATSPASNAQNVPISVEPPTQAPASYSAPAQATSGNQKRCPNCNFAMPASALFCPNCGSRVGV